MCQYTIIEDASPFFIRFKFDALDKILRICKNYKFPSFNGHLCRHVVVPPKLSKLILALAPMSNDIDISPDRVSFFLTEPGGYYGAHRDGKNMRFGINFTTHIFDDKCVTNWYSSKDLNHHKISNGNARNVIDWKKENYLPIKSMTANPNEAILFNTQIFHDWDNSRSTNRRAILTLRPKDSSNTTFDNVKKALFDI